MEDEDEGSSSEDDGKSPYVLLVSGLHVGGADCKDSALPANMLVDFVAGHIGGPEDIKVAARIARVIVCGNCRSECPPHLLVASGKLSASAQEVIHGPMKELDAMFSVLASAVPTDVMPGPSDPSGHWMPQQPMPACVFPNASRFSSTFNRCSNPYEANIGGRHFLGTAGQPIDDLRKFAKLKPSTQPKTEPMENNDGSMEDTAVSAASASSSSSNKAEGGVAALCPGEECVGWLESMVRWRHMAPTAPDTLDTYPYLATDPFVLEATPNVFFAGNQAAFSAKKMTLPTTSASGGFSNEVCLLVSVPSFAATGEVVLVDLRTLDCAPMRFRGLPPPPPSVE